MAHNASGRASDRMMMRLATLGPVGFLRPAPGSWGSVAALVMGAGLAFLSPRLLEIAALVVCILGTVAAGIYQRQTGRHDAGEVVIDEVAGQWIALLVVPLPVAASMGVRLPRYGRGGSRCGSGRQWAGPLTRST